MITLDPEFVGSLAPLSRVTEAGDDGRLNVPYARLPRYERLRVSGKVDEMEDIQEGEAQDGENGEVDAANAERKTEIQEKKRMRGKGKSMKRCVVHMNVLSSVISLLVRYLRKQRKNVIDPKAVIHVCLFLAGWR